ncbi:hypothetical protein HYDPIDRAFT_78152, partial [Hydnomerulius pinastri MD-312]
LMYYSTDRITSAATSFLGAAFNFALAAQLFSAWRSLTWEPESEWEGSGFSLNKDGARLICGLFSAYFGAASAICVFGLTGIIKSTPSFVRIYRNYLIGDFAFFTLFAGLASSAIFDPASRSNVCEQITRQPDLLRDVIDLGLNLENCEQWFERGVVAFMLVLIFITVIRLHFIFALSRYYGHLVHSHRQTFDPALPAPLQDNDFVQLERIYLLPGHSNTAGNKESFVDAPIYAPVPLAQVSSQMADELRASATEAWVSRGRLPPHRFMPSHPSGNDRLRSMHPLPHRSPLPGPIHLTDEKL